MRVAVGVDVRAAVGAKPRRLSLREAHVRGCIQYGDTAGEIEPRKPRLVIESDADEKRGAPRSRKLRRLQFHCMRVLLRRSEAFDFDTRTADSFRKGLQ